MSKRWPLALLVMIVVAGGWIRLQDLGPAPFFGDELDHYYAASALNEDGRPLLPSGESYDRGRTYTAMVALSLRFIDEPEVAARLPSALFGVAGLILFAFLARAIGGGWAAVWGTLLLAVYPEAILQSRQSRFYTYQMVWGLVALYAGWRTIRPVELPVDSREPIVRTWMWAVVTIVAFAAASSIQVTTLSVLLAWGLAVLLAAVQEWSRAGRGSWRTSPVILLVASGVLVGLAGLAREASRGMPMLDLATFVPAWASQNPADARTYLWAIADVFPVVVPLLPLIFIGVGLRRSRGLAVFLALWFGVPLLLHSIILPWKGERYIFLAMPALFIAAGISAAAACEALFRVVQARLPGGSDPTNRAARGGAAITIGLVSLALVVATPAVRRATRPAPIQKDFRWRVAGQLIQALPGAGLVPLGSSMGLPALFYLGRVDFVVGTDFLQRTSRQPAPEADSLEASGSSTAPTTGQPGGQEGQRPPVIDWYSGVPVLTTPETIWQHHPEAARVILAVDGHRMRFGNVDPALMEALSQDAEELCQGQCGDLSLYLLRRDAPQESMEGSPAGDPSDENTG